MRERSYVQFLFFGEQKRCQYSKKKIGGKNNNIICFKLAVISEVMGQKSTVTSCLLSPSFVSKLGLFTMFLSLFEALIKMCHDWAEIKCWWVVRGVLKEVWWFISPDLNFWIPNLIENLAAFGWQLRIIRFSAALNPLFCLVVIRKNSE